MKAIITQELLKERLSYDPETGIFTAKKYPYGKMKAGQKVGHLTKQGYWFISLKGKSYGAHRLAWLYVYGKHPDNCIDHIDRNPLNNSIANLREATRGQNNQNTNIRNKLGVRGIRKTDSGKYKAAIIIDGKALSSRPFSTQEEASYAYNAVARKYFGDFAKRPRINLESPINLDLQSVAWEGPMKTLNKLQPTSLTSLDPGLWADGNNLYFQVTLSKVTGKKTHSWVYRYRIHGKTREAGVGAYPRIGLASARKLAEGMAVMLMEGRDPIEVRRTQRALKRDGDTSTRMTLKRTISTYIAAKKSSWSKAQKDKWEDPLRLHVYPVVGNLHLGAVDDGVVRSILEPLWSTKRATAKHIRACLEAVIGWAQYMKYIPKGPNPAAWKGALEHHFDGGGKQTNHEAMDYRQVPAFMKELAGRRAMAADCLRFLILTATRTNEAVGAEWTEIDFENKVWTIPKERMKAGKEHKVPLSGAAIELLNSIAVIPALSKYIFPGTDPTTHLEESTMRYLKRRMGVKETIHGMRSAARTFADEETDFPHEVKEAMLAHQIPNEVERAYVRGSLLEKRRQLMEAWAEYITK